MKGDKKNSHNERVWKALLGTILFFAIGSFVILAVDLATDNGTPNLSLCNDYDPCTQNLVLPDGSCITPPRVRSENWDCTTEDQCYTQPYNSTWHLTHNVPLKRCIAGTCTSYRKRCNGYCYNDTRCTDFPLPLRLDQMNGTVLVDTYCFAQSCITTVTGGFTSECSSWIDTRNTSGNHHAQYIEKCLYMSFDDLGGDFPDGVCYYRYECAPFDYRPPVIPASYKRAQAAQNDAAPPSASSALRMRFGREPMSGAQNQGLRDLIMAGIERYRLANPRT